MEIAAFVSFVALVLAWVALPLRAPAKTGLMRERPAEAAD